MTIRNVGLFVGALVLFFATLTPSSASAAEGKPTNKERFERLRTLSVITLAAGAATLGTSAYFNYRAADKRDHADAHCSDQPVFCDAHGHLLRESATAWQNAATGMMAIGGGLILVGAVLFGYSYIKLGSVKIDPPRVGWFRILPGYGQVAVKATF